MIIHQGIRSNDRQRAAVLYWEAFGEKLNIPLGPRKKALAFVDRVLDPAHAISALDEHGNLLGIVGFKTHNGALVGGDFDDLIAVYGLLGAAWRATLLILLERDTENERFLMDGIFVAAHARGNGVGTALLNEVVQEAGKRGFRHVRLDVIDTNPRARALYEREGFIATKTQTLGLLRHIFGFASATTMVRRV